MSTPEPKTTLLRTCTALLTMGLAASGVAAQSPKATHLGKAMTAEDVARWNLTVFPDGRGLPAGSGTGTTGQAIYDSQCRHCHGDDGQGGTAEELAAPQEPLTTPYASKAIGPYWPYAPTLFDYIRRAMPPTAPGTLSNDDVYAVTAYLLAANGIIAKDQRLDAKALAEVKMPNRDGFVGIDAKP